MANLIYLGNIRTVSKDELQQYCSKFGFIMDYSTRLASLNIPKHLLDFTFIQFLTAQSYQKFLSIQSHTLSNDIVLDVRPFDEVLHAAVPLHVDRKICVENVPGHLSLSDLKKYFRTFGTIKQSSVEVDDENDQRFVFIEFESGASKNKLLKGKIRIHRVRDYPLTISPFLRPTDIDLTSIQNQS